jgi:hypothetical protein
MLKISTFSCRKHHSNFRVNNCKDYVDGKPLGYEEYLRKDSKNMPEEMESPWLLARLKTAAVKQ